MSIIIYWEKYDSQKVSFQRVPELRNLFDQVMFPQYLPLSPRRGEYMLRPLEELAVSDREASAGTRKGGAFRRGVRNEHSSLRSPGLARDKRDKPALREAKSAASG
jgi:hypothetical protein